jgi:hypothetical protein
MYTCGELTHSPSDGDLGGPASPRPASRLQKREAAGNGRSRLANQGQEALLKRAAKDGRPCDLRNQDDCKDQ